MFFTAHTSYSERRVGALPYQTLMERYLSNKEDFLKDSPQGLSEIEVSIGLGDKVYELEVSIDPREPDTTGIFWMELETYKRQVSGGSPVSLVDKRVPLNWYSVARSLCETFDIPVERVWAEGVNLYKYWDDVPNRDMWIPTEKQKAKYSLAKLYGPLPHQAAQ
jgi:hypothetical protein